MVCWNSSEHHLARAGLVRCSGYPPTSLVNWRSGFVVCPGWAAGIDRLLLLSKLEPIPARLPVTVLPIADSSGEAVELYALQVAEMLRRGGVSAVIDWSDRKLSLKLRAVAKNGSSDVVVVVGDDEVAKQAVAVKSMKSNSQETVPVTSLLDAIHNVLLLE
jgi:histidyl-tRNA synthetase